MGNAASSELKASPGILETSSKSRQVEETVKTSQSLKDSKTSSQSIPETDSHLSDETQNYKKTCETLNPSNSCIIDDKEEEEEEIGQKEKEKEEIDEEQYDNEIDEEHDDDEIDEEEKKTFPSLQKSLKTLVFRLRDSKALIDSLSVSSTLTTSSISLCSLPTPLCCSSSLDSSSSYTPKEKDSKSLLSTQLDSSSNSSELSSESNALTYKPSFPRLRISYDSYVTSPPSEEKCVTGRREKRGENNERRNRRKSNSNIQNQACIRIPYSSFISKR